MATDICQDTFLIFVQFYKIKFFIVLALEIEPERFYKTVRGSVLLITPCPYVCRPERIKRVVDNRRRALFDISLTPVFFFKPETYLAPAGKVKVIKRYLSYKRAAEFYRKRIFLFACFKSFYEI